MSDTKLDKSNDKEIKPKKKAKPFNKVKVVKDPLFIDFCLTLDFISLFSLTSILFLDIFLPYWDTFNTVLDQK